MKLNTGQLNVYSYVKDGKVYGIAKNYRADDFTANINSKDKKKDVSNWLWSFEWRQVGLNGMNGYGRGREYL